MSNDTNRNFSEALISLKNGKRIKRGCKTYRLYENNMGDWCLAMEYPINGFTFADMMAEDWEVINNDK